MIARWTPRAIADLDAIHAYIAEDDPRAAAKLVADVTRLVETTLVANPQMGRPGRVAGTRELLARRTYIIAYRAEADALDILTVRHAARLWPERF